RALKEVGYAGFSVNSALGALANIGQQLFDPPDVSGWDLGTNWFSTGSMLARMNFAATLTLNQRFNIAAAARGKGSTPEALLSFYLDQMTPADYDRAAYSEDRKSTRLNSSHVASSYAVVCLKKKIHMHR